MKISPQNREQQFIFNSLDDLVSNDNPVRIIDIIIKKIIKNSPNEYKYKGESPTGRPAYSCETMLKIFLYGYLNRITSSRRLEQETHRNLELIWLIGNLRPDFKTIADFRRDNPKLISRLCKDIRSLIKSMGLINTDSIAIDSTKLKANASQDMQSRSDILERLSQLETELDGYIADMNRQDTLEATATAQSPLPSAQELTLQTKINSLEQEVAILKAKLDKMNETGKNYISDTDPDCNLQKSHGSYIPGYSVQIVTDTEHNFILNEYVTSAANDMAELPKAVAGFVNEHETTPLEVLADTGYCNLDQIQQIEQEQGITCYVPHPKEQGKTQNITFEYDEANDCYTCSEGKRLTLRHSNKKAKKSYVNVYVGESCADCPLREKCTKSKLGRHISRFSNQKYRQLHKARMLTPIGRDKSITRKASVEHIFGTMKLWLGQIPLLTRGTKKVTTEIKLFVSSYNIKRLLSLMSFKEMMEMLKMLEIRFNLAMSKNFLTVFSLLSLIAITNSKQNYKIKYA